MQRVDNWRVDPVGERERGEAAVVVEDVEGRIGLLHAREGRGRVVDLVERHLDLIGMRPLERRQHLGIRARTGRREQRDLVPARRQLIGSSAITCSIPP